MPLTQCNTLVYFTSIMQRMKGHVNTCGLKVCLHTVIINSGKYFLHTQAFALCKHDRRNPCNGGNATATREFFGAKVTKKKVHVIYILKVHVPAAAGYYHLVSSLDH
jgi:hypothetical protein